MGALARTLTPRVANGKPLQTAKNVVMFGDNLRATIYDGIPLLFGVAFLYDKAFIEGEDASWGLSDVLLVWMAAWAVKRIGVVRRWA